MSRIQTSLVIDDKLYKKVRKYGIDNRLTKTEIIEEALKDYLENNK